MSTISKLRKQANQGPQYTLYIEGAGFLSNSQPFAGGIRFTHDINNAMHYSQVFDTPEIKLGYWNAQARRYFDNPYIEFSIINLPKINLLVDSSPCTFFEFVMTNTAEDVEAVPVEELNRVAELKIGDSLWVGMSQVQRIA